jgi:hypothetical protein
MKRSPRPDRHRIVERIPLNVSERSSGANKVRSMLGHLPRRLLAPASRWRDLANAIPSRFLAQLSACPVRTALSPKSLLRSTVALRNFQPATTKFYPSTSRLRRPRTPSRPKT